MAHRTIKNSWYNLLAFIWPVVLSLVATPIIVHGLGVHDYGVYVLALVIVSFLSLLEMGWGYGFIKSLADLSARNDHARINVLVSSFFWLTTFLGTVGLIIAYLFADTLVALFKLGVAGSSPAVGAIYFAGWIFLSAMVSAVFSLIPTALQRFDVPAKWGIFSATLMNALMVAAVWQGFSVVALLAVYLLISAASFVFYFFYSKHLLPLLKVECRFDYQAVKPAAKFGFFVFLNNIASTALIQIDRFFISAFLGPAFITFYTLPGNVAQKIHGFVSSISNVFFPLSSDLVARGDLDRLQRIYRKVVRITTILSFASAITLWLFGYKILFYWLGQEIANNSISVLYYLVPTYFLLSIFVPLTNFLLGLGKPKILAFSSIFMAALNVILVLILVPRYSIEGAALAYLLSVTPVIFLLFFLERKELMFQGSLNFYLKIFVKLMATGAVFYLVVGYTIFNLAVGLISLITVLPFAFASFLVLYKLMGFVEKEDWDLIVGIWLNFKNKFSNVS